MAMIRTRGGEPSIHEVLAQQAIQAVYQPIVDLATGETLAYEALARGPVGTSLTSPDALFAEAARHGVVPALDRACRVAAVEGAARHQLNADLALFVNVEPASMAAIDDDVEPLLTVSVPSSVVIEVTERMLCDSPAELLAFLGRARARGLGIALDDVGAVDESLALMPFLQPDVVKLDLSLVQQRTRRDNARVVTAVLAYAEETGAAVLAEGIETEEHLHRAVTLGATLGQGWYFGRPGPLPAPSGRGSGQAGPSGRGSGQAGETSPPTRPLAATLPFVSRPAGPPVGPTPYDLVSAARPVREGRRSQLLGLSHHLEQRTLETAQPEVVISAFQYGNRFTPATGRRYAQLAEACALVAALGVDLPVEPVPGVRGAALAADDPLRDEWVVTVVGPHYAGALVARQVGPDEPDARFSFTITHNRALVLQVATSLLQRVLRR